MPPPPPQHWKQGFSRRLGYYMLGLSIGLILMGFLYLSRRSEARQREAANQSQILPQIPASPPAR